MWTKERIDRLTELWASGHSASVIAAYLGGVTRNAVIGKVHRLGLSSRDTTSRTHTPRAPRPRVIRTPRERQPRLPRRRIERPRPILRSQSNEQTKGEIRREFESIWLNTVAIQNRMGA